MQPFISKTADPVAGSRNGGSAYRRGEKEQSSGGSDLPPGNVQSTDIDECRIASQAGALFLTGKRRKQRCDGFGSEVELSERFSGLFFF